jgi:DNA topoisomerase-1
MKKMDVKDTVIIIESPNKIKKMKEYTNAKIIATVGHFKDIPNDNGLGIDLKTYQPTFKVVKGKSKIVAELKACTGKKIYIATDPDREGYAIGTHVFNIVKKAANDVYRAEIREITQVGVTEALRAARPFSETNIGIYDAFLGRRVGDRLIGFLMSPLASNSLKAVYSVGRVQTPGLRLVVDRENEIQIFKASTYFKLELKLNCQNVEFKAFHEAGKIDDQGIIDAIMNKLSSAEKKAVVNKIESKKLVKSPKAPFTTSTLQQAANNRLSLGVEQTMELAQGLFEKGLITYHRTDSQRISGEFIAEAREHIRAEYGMESCPEKAYDYISKNSQADAHEAIRPTHVFNLDDIKKIISDNNLTELHEKLLRLIATRTIASQMSPAVFDSTKVTLSFGDELFIASGSVMISPGYNKIYEDTEKKDEDENDKMPKLVEGQIVDVIDYDKITKFTKAPARYTEATLVKELEKRGIGRPSTYASILKTLKTRKYVKLDKKYLTPSPEGIKLINYLNANYKWVIDYDLTRTMEDYLDLVEAKKAKWQDFVKKLHERLGFIDPPDWAVFK